MHIVFSQGILTNVYFLSGYTFSRIPNFQGIHLLIIMIVSTISKGLYKFLRAFFVNAEKYDFRVILNDPEFFGKTAMCVSSPYGEEILCRKSIESFMKKTEKKLPK